MLDLVDETLRQMTLLVPVFIVIPAHFSVLPRWDDHFSSGFEKHLEKIVCVIRAIRNQALKIQLEHQFHRLGNVMPLTTSQAKAQWISQAIHAHMDFGAETSSAATQRLFALASVFFDAPAAHGCARMMVLSRIRFSISGSSAKC